jgi:hypothetical protein
MSIIPALRMLRQEDFKFKVSLGYIAKSCKKRKERKKEGRKKEKGREEKGRHEGGREERNKSPKLHKIVFILSILHIAEKYSFCHQETR